ncbi:MAG TPA: glutaredoxin family protein, partial [Actinomycetota bacterium]|nr:glutaredoxin family protein [Actinomycetota bacterium]
PRGQRDVPRLPAGLGAGPAAGRLRPMSMSRVVLYTRVGCHLCEEAERVLREERAAAPFDLELVDVDHDPELARRYGVRVPVVAVDGEELFEYEVPVDLLRARLGRVGTD